MRIEKFGGTDERLYQSVAKLVMNPEVLRQNNNYPFKTSIHHIWFVAFDEELVIGFMPVEVKNKSIIINNYYIPEENETVLPALLEETVQYFTEEYELLSVSQRRDMVVFQEKNFEVTREWKLYVKMVYRKPQDDV